MHETITAKTAELFGDLWHRYDDALFEESVRLFSMRFQANGFDLRWFVGKRCLDAGCGGGRYAIAIARLGAAEVIGCDISNKGLEDARIRAAGLSNIRFERASVLDLPYENNSFDFVCCSGVLHHTPDPLKGLVEIRRVLRPGGRVFILLYGKGGLRWPTIQKLRPVAQTIGYETMSQLMQEMALPSNKQRTFLDDLFVPVMHFCAWEEVYGMLRELGFEHIQRWQKGKQASVVEQKAELLQLLELFQTAHRKTSPTDLTNGAVGIIKQAIEILDQTEREFLNQRINNTERNQIVFGWDHHRVMATLRLQA